MDLLTCATPLTQPISRFCSWLHYLSWSPLESSRMAPLYVWYFVIFVMSLSIFLYHVISLAVSFFQILMYWRPYGLSVSTSYTSLILVSLLFVLLKPPEDRSGSAPVPVACAAPGGPSPCRSPCSLPRRGRALTRAQPELGGYSLPEQIPKVCSLTFKNIYNLNPKCNVIYKLCIPALWLYIKY